MDREVGDMSKTATTTAIAAAAPAATVPTLPRGDRDMAAAVSAQWGRAQEGLVEILKFGAILLELERRLAMPSQRAGMYGGATLKQWLRELCPEIRYDTALGYKAAAAGVIKAAELPDELPLLALMDGDAAYAQQHEDARARVMEVVATASIASLKVRGRTKKRGGARDGAGRPAKIELPPLTPDQAAAEVYPVIAKLYNWTITEDGWGLLGDADLTTMLATINDIYKRGKIILDARRR